MKRILSISLVCLMLCLLAACGTAPSAEDGHTDANGNAEVAGGTDAAFASYTSLTEKLNAAAGEDAQYDIDMVIETNMKFGDESFETTINGNMKMKMEGDAVWYSMTMDMGEGGIMEIYSDGERVYCTLDGEEQVLEMSDMLDQIDSSLNLPEFEKNAIKSCESENVDGGVRTDMVIDGEEMTQFIDEIMGALTELLGEDSEIMIDDIALSILTDNDGNPMEMEMGLNMKMGFAGQEIEMDANYKYIFNKIGSGVEIDLSAMAV